MINGPFFETSTSSLVFVLIFFFTKDDGVLLLAAEDSLPRFRLDDAGVAVGVAKKRNQ
jgi:hypothetical protein